MEEAAGLLICGTAEERRVVEGKLRAEFTSHAKLLQVVPLGLPREENDRRQEARVRVEPVQEVDFGRDLLLPRRRGEAVHEMRADTQTHHQLASSPSVVLEACARLRRPTPARRLGADMLRPRRRSARTLERSEV